MAELKPLELQRVFANDADNLRRARDSAITIHHTKDIDTAGDEVEIPVRTWLATKLGLSYHIGHGHIVDSRLIASPQIDIAVVSNESTPVLLRAENGAEYLPYESVYAIGEAKSSYSKNKKYIENYSGTLRTLRGQLQRAQTSTNYIGGGIALGEGFQLDGIGTPYRNPLLSFMLFVDRGDFSWHDISGHYASTPATELPNIVCILNRGIIVNTRISRPGRRVLSFNVCPEFNPPDTGDVCNRWSFIGFGDDAERAGYSLAALFLTLASHVSSCVLMRPNVHEYMNHIFVGVPKSAESVGPP